MRKLAALGAAFAVGCALGAVALADSGPPVTTTTDTTAATTTTGATTTTAAAAVIAEGVTVGDVDLGGMTRDAAYAAVRSAFATPLVLRFHRHRLAARPDVLGAVGFARQAVSAAFHATPGASVPLQVSVRPGPLRRYLRGLAAQLNQAPVDAKLTLRGGRPFVWREVPGTAIDVEAALQAVSSELLAGGRDPLALPALALAPKLTRRDIGAVIVIHRGVNRLELYHGTRLDRTFGVATGQTRYPTPLGRFSIVVKWRNPWWYPPPDPWAAGEKPTPPGPGNPLGTRWMGLSAPGVGIHGTPQSGSIGYSLSHGCIRMLIPQAEWLFDHVAIGTPVYILAS
jgi:hypothetical protein